MEDLASADSVLLSTVFDGVVLIDPKTLSIVRANRAAADIMGFDSPGDMAGLQPLASILDDDRQRAAELMSGVASGTGPEQGVEVRARNRRGQEIWVLARGVSLPSNGSTVILASFRDITAQKQAEMALRQAGEEQIQLLNTSGELILISQDWKVVFINRTLEDTIGVSASTLVGLSILDMTHPDDREAVRRTYQSMLDGKGAASSRPFKGIGREGREAWGLMRHVPVTWQGRPALMSVIQDVTQQKREEEALRQSEQKYRDLAEKTNDVIWTADLGFRVTYMSPSVEKILGRTPAEVVGHLMQDFIAPESWQHIVGVMAEQLRLEMEGTGDRDAVVCTETEFYRKDGSSIWLENLASRIRDGQGRLVGIYGISRDVTERRRVEEEARLAAREWQGTFDSVADMISVHDREGRIVRANRAFAESLGLKPGEIGGRHCYEVVHGTGAHWPGCPHLRCMAQGRPCSEELWEPRLGKYLQVSVSPVFDSSGEVAGSVHIARDITESKKTEEALQLSQGNFRALLENSAAVVFSLDTEARVVDISPAIERLSGFRPDELVGQSALHWVVPEDVTTLISSMEKTLQGVVEPFVFRARYKNGTVHHMLTSGRPIYLDGKLTGLLGIMVDVSEAKAAEEALRASEANYRNLFDHTLMGLQVIDLETMKTVLASEAMARMLGFDSGAAMAGTEPLDLVLPDDLDVVIAELTRMLANPGTHTMYTFRVRSRDGRVVWVTTMGSVFEYVCRPSILLSVLDVTREKEAQLKVAESEGRYRLITENSSDVIWTMDMDLHMTYVSPSIEKLTGYTAEESMAMDMISGMTQGSLDKATRRLAEGLAGNPDPSGKAPVPEMMELEMLCKDGSTVWTEVQMSFMQDPEGRVVGIMGVARNISERRRAQQALEESESRYRLLAENVSDVIWSLNMKTRKSFFSPSVSRLLGYTVEEAQSLRMSDIISPSSRSRAMTAFSGEPSKPGDGRGAASLSAQLEIELIRKDGTFVWVDISETMMLDAEGKPEEVFGVMRDVNERRKAEEALRSSEEYFRALIENAWDAIIIIDARGTLLYESPSSVRITGWQPQEVVGRNVTKFVHQDHLPELVAKYEKLTTEPGSSMTVNAAFKHKDGHYIECECTLHNLLRDPKINGVVANYRDITDRRRAEEAIRTSEERFRNLVEATSDWVWETDPRGIYTYVSPKVREVMGYDVGEIIGRSIFDYMPAKESSRFAATFQAAAAGNQPFSFVENSRLHRDGRVVVMETSGVPFFADDGSLLGYRGIGRDITSRKKVERDLENSVKKVEKTMEAAIQAISYTMETRDPYTTGHQKRVTQLACAIAKEMGIGQWQIDGIRVAGLLHDLGKIAVPTEILSKPGKLSDIEFSMIKAHPKVGFDILQNVEFEWPIARIVVQHHERLNGSGYPFGTKGKDILLEARILAVADVVEAMASHRPYRPALGLDRALDEVARGEGTLYDPEVVRACRRVIGERNFKFEG